MTSLVGPVIVCDEHFGNCVVLTGLGNNLLSVDRLYDADLTKVDPEFAAEVWPVREFFAELCDMDVSRALAILAEHPEYLLGVEAYKAKMCPTA